MTSDGTAVELSTLGAALLVGAPVGDPVGTIVTVGSPLDVGTADGMSVGPALSDGAPEGQALGSLLGILLGDKDGEALVVGLPDGAYSIVG